MSEDKKQTCKVSKEFIMDYTMKAEQLQKQIEELMKETLDISKKAKEKSQVVFTKVKDTLAE